MSSRYQSRHERLLHTRRRIVLMAALAAAVPLVLGIFLGQRAAYSGMGVDLESYREMQTQLPQLLSERAQLQEQLAVWQTRNEVDRNALEMLRVELAGQNQQIAELDEALQFYRGIMAPENAAEAGLRLRPMEFIALESDRSYAYRLLLLQEARKHQLLSGTVSVHIVGQRAGETVSLPLAQLDTDVETDEFALRFRYFQPIEGEILLPEGFAPLRVEVEASSSKPRKQHVSANFDWQVKERFSYVGQ